MMKIKSMKYTGIILVTSLLVISGCKLNKPYQRPDLGEPDVFYGDGASTAENAINPVNTYWAEFFNDSLLVSLIDTALANNIDLKIADAYVEIGLARLKQAKANFLPSVDASPFRYRQDMFSENYNNYGSNRARRNHGPDVPTSFYTERLEYEAAVALNWELDVWGKLSSLKRARQHAYMQTMEFRKAVQTSLIADISSTYFVLGLLKSQIAVYKDNLALNTNTLKIVNLQFEAGEVTSLAVKQTLSQKLRAQSLIPQLEREYIRQENRLNRMLGRSGRSIELRDLESPIIDDEYVAGLPIELLSNRPDMAAAEYKLKEAYERVGIANAMRYPSVSLGSTVGLNSMELGKLLDPTGSGFLLVGASVFQPIFQNRKLRTNYEVAMKEKEIAELKFKDTFLQAMNEVSNALVSIKKLKEEYVIAQERVAAAKNAVEDASFLFKSGLANYLEVITAQTEALNSELNLENLKMQIFTADVELYRSLGGGWEEPD